MPIDKYIKEITERFSLGISTEHEIVGKVPVKRLN